jgi:steroid 5-alpha reductase family enzyme
MIDLRKEQIAITKNTKNYHYPLLVFSEVILFDFHQLYFMKNQNLLSTSILLIIALIIIPIVAILYDEPLNPIQMHILKTLVFAMLSISLICFILGEITKNYSQTDKLWSIVPFFYVAYVAYASNWQPRLILMMIVVGIWSARLTYNFNRRGGYSWKFWTGEEDYRWTVLRQESFLQGKFRFTLFNLFFICLYQQALILAFTLPSVVTVAAQKSIGILDIILAVLLVGFVIIETIADQQQWNFQTEKYRRKSAGEPLNTEQSQGFISSGLWSKVRHPNYASEQSIWIAFYLFSVVATGRIINWSMVGCILLVILFQSSANFSENISANKYPDYKDYQKRVPKFFPKFW